MKNSPPLRCAIYTRKSSEEGLEQEFNSLHAQREAAESYIKSQKHEGWKIITTQYDDGGFSGGTMERPALKELLNDIQARKIDIVVVYKVDRLSRSLHDFARIIELFDKHNVSFVSVTQAFSTTTSMGRLTLNILLSFAQFEREVTGERIRDKLAASKKKGMWLGGYTPLGYDVNERKLQINSEEAKEVLHIYERYAELGSVAELQKELNNDGYRTKSWITSKEAKRGGNSYTKNVLHTLLTNHLYVGEVAFKDEIYEGQHEAIIERALWERVQAIHQKGIKRSAHYTQHGNLLKSKCFTSDNLRFIPTYTRKTDTSQFRYYVCKEHKWNITAYQLESAVIHAIRIAVQKQELWKNSLLWNKKKIYADWQSLWNGWQFFNIETQFRISQSLIERITVNNDHLVICVDKQTDAIQGSILELIDGQQRFTTLSLLMLALYDALNSKVNESDDFEDKSELHYLKQRLIIKNSNVPRLTPSEQKNNKNDYIALIAHVLKLSEHKISLSKSIFGAAFTYFKNRLNDPVFTKEQLFEFLKKAVDAKLVKIEVKNYADAYILFEAINNRGIPLSAIDIIKNLLLSKLEQHPDYPNNLAFEKWMQLVERIPDDTQERFLRHYYNAFKHDPKVKMEGIRRANKSNLINLYESIIKNDCASFFADFEQKSRLYSYMINEQIIPTGWSKEAKRLVINLQRIGAAPAYTFLLWALSFATARSWDIGKCFELLAGYILSWFVRRSLTDTPPTRELDALFEGLIEYLSTLPQIATIEELVVLTTAELEKKAAPSEMVREKLHGPIYQYNTDITRFLLCIIEEQHFTDERAPHLWERNEQNRYIWTIEHIFPEGSNIPQSWVTMIAEGEASKAIAIQERIVHCLGNLTLSGYNGNLSNRSFADKRDLNNDKGNCIGYKNGLYLNKEVAMQEIWNEQMILARTRMLADEIIAWLGL